VHAGAFERRLRRDQLLDGRIDMPASLCLLEQLLHEHLDRAHALGRGVAHEAVASRFRRRTSRWA
jgi:hypothetical protein